VRDFKMSNHVIYGLIDPDTKELKYVGFSSRVEKRYNEHIKPSALKQNTYKNNWIKSLIKKKLRPELIILETYELAEKLPQAEIEVIEYYKFIGCRLVNGDPGGIGGKGRKHSEEENKAKSERQKGKIFSKEYKLKISQSKIGHIVTQETRDKISKANLGKPSPTKGTKLSEQTKKKKSEAMTGKTWKLVDGKRVWSDK